MRWWAKRDVHEKTSPRTITLEPKSDIPEKLRRLKKMLDEGLISDDDAAKKRRQILKSF
jgi:hypothetical protein